VSTSIIEQVQVKELVARGIVKQFPGVLASDHVNFDVHSGEIHTLLGENGAGKSTLMKILYGMYRPDAGEVLINGTPVRFHSPLDAIRQGIGMVHQHFMLVPTFTVAENVALGLPSSRRVVLDPTSFLGESRSWRRRTDCTSIHRQRCGSYLLESNRGWRS